MVVVSIENPLKNYLLICFNLSKCLGSLPITANHLGAGLHAAGLSAAISSAAAAGLVGENTTSPVVQMT